MKTVTMSQRFYYQELEDNVRECVRYDIETYASMLHKAYRMLYDIYFYNAPKPQNMCKDLKQQYHTSDYLPLSAINEARGILKSTIECNKRQQLSSLKRIQRVEKEMKKITTKINLIQEHLSVYIEISKQHKTTELDYLMEIEEKANLKSLMHQKSMLCFRLHRERFHLKGLKKRVKQVCFGGRKRMKKQFAMCKQHEEWKKEFQQARMNRMVIPRLTSRKVWE
ncbi:MAG: hypothetical protein RR690_06980 [Longicatena sp.]